MLFLLLFAMKLWDWVLWSGVFFFLLRFKPAFSLSSFTLIKKLFSSSSLSAIRVVLSAYLRVLIIHLAILIPACDSSSLVFCMMYSAYKLNKQDDNVQACHTPFPILIQSVVPHPVLTVASWFLSRQVRFSDSLITLRIFGSLLWSTESIPRSGRSPGEGNGYPLQYSCLENFMDRGAFWQ